MNNKVENPFDKAAVEWDADALRKELTSAVAEAVKEMCEINSEMSVMEYGCGTGNLSFMLADKVAGITAVDSSAGMIAEMQKKLANSAETKIKPVLLDFTGNAVLDEKFDLIITVMTLHHIEHQERLLAKFAEMLLPGGKVFIADLYEEDGSFHTDKVVPHNGFCPEKLASQLHSCELKNCQQATIHTISKNNKEYPMFALLGQ